MSDDAAVPKVSASAFDLLQIELVPLAYRLHGDVLARNAELVSRSGLGQLLPSNPRRRRRRGGAGLVGVEQGGSTAGGGANGSNAQLVGGVADVGAGIAGLGIDGTSNAGGAGAGTATGIVDREEGEDEDEGVREAVFFRLDALGYRVGQGLVERFSAGQPRPTTDLDKIKFVCKDLWTRVFKKQIDNLKTNHRGTFVLTDARFQPLHRMSADRKLGPRGVDQALNRAQPFLWFPCGIIRGALQGLGMDTTVNAETTDLPIATFQIRVVGAKP